MKEKEHNVPVLRFPGFDGEWEKKRLGEIVAFLSGGTPSKKNTEYWDGEIPWISATAMHTDKIENSEIYVTEEGVKNGTKIAKLNTVLLLVRGSMLFKRIPAGICVRDVAFNQDVKALSIIGRNSPYFLLYFIRSKEHRLLSLVTGTGIGAGKLDTNELKTLPFTRPSLPEQQKIASFLTAVDSKIEQLNRKKALLEQYKKGMMKKLFNQELRFKDEQGNNFPDWEEKRLGDIVIFIKNGTTENQNSNKEGIKVTRIETISDSKIDINRVGYIDSPEDFSKFKLHVGDLLFSNINSVTHIGKTVIVDKDYDLYHGMNLLNIRIDSEMCSALLVYYILTSRQYKCYFEKICNKAVNQASINQTDLKKTVFNLPTLAEQRKIATFLLSIDKKIDLITTELNHAQAFKKGLLQQMFV